MVTVTVTHAAPHHLIADRPVALRRTRGGDAWEAINMQNGSRGPAESPACAVGAGAVPATSAAPGTTSPGPVLIGMPGIGQPR
jgi:tRNA-2-methylthio-N6-dimethylallyladenosine synthase